jgi:hypothetical protein
MNDTRLIWKVRSVKPYPGAHNHLLVGQVASRDAVCLELMCRSFHYGRVVSVLKDIVVGSIGKRIVPWNRIEIINELPASFDFQNAKLHADQKGGVFFSDGHYFCPIVTVQDKHY